MGFYETMYLIRALNFVPGTEGVTSNNVKKINGKWYYIATGQEDLQIDYFRSCSDLSDVIHILHEDKKKKKINYDKYNTDIITEECSLKGLKLDWYIYTNGFTTLNMSSYSSLKKITNEKGLVIDNETIEKFRKINNNKIIIEKMEDIQEKIEKLNLEYKELKNTLN